MIIVLVGLLNAAQGEIGGKMNLNSNNRLLTTTCDHVFGANYSDATKLKTFSIKSEIRFGQNKF